MTGPGRTICTALKDQTSHKRRERYDVELVLTTFDGSMYDTIKLMRCTELFMGMHGAGFTNHCIPAEGTASPTSWAVGCAPMAVQAAHAGQAFPACSVCLP